MIKLNVEHAVATFEYDIYEKKTREKQLFLNLDKSHMLFTEYLQTRSAW